MKQKGLGRGLSAILEMEQYVEELGKVIWTKCLQTALMPQLLVASVLSLFLFSLS